MLSRKCARMSSASQCAHLPLLDEVTLGLMGAEGEGLGLGQCDGAGGQRVLRLIAEADKGDAAFDGRGAQARLRGDILDVGLTVLKEPGDGGRFVQRRKVLALDVFHGGDAYRILAGEIGTDIDGHRVIASHVPLFQQQLQGTVAPFAADNTVLAFFAPAERDHDEILQNAIGQDAGGKAFDARSVDGGARVHIRRLNRRQRQCLNGHGHTPLQSFNGCSCCCTPATWRTWG